MTVRWIFKESKHTVQVASENKALPKNSFLVTGYDVSGSVVFDKQPISNIQLILLSDVSIVLKILTIKGNIFLKLFNLYIV